MTAAAPRPAASSTRSPAVAGSFYPADPRALRGGVLALLRDAAMRFAWPEDLGPPVGLLVPHAGLAYSGTVAAAGWSGLARTDAAAAPPTIVILGTNHRAAWLDGIAVWPQGTWRTPLGDVPVDEGLAGEILGLREPYTDDPAAHLAEHSIEVQLPLVRAVAPAARIVPLAVSAGTSDAAIVAGRRLGRLLTERRARGRPVVVAISSDMAHYPPHDVARTVTEALVPAILALDAAGLARAELAVRAGALPGLACGMCGIEPAVVGLAALREMGATAAAPIAAATSADADGPSAHTVGYLAVGFASPG